MNWIPFDAVTCATVPWRNGGGTTCELLTWRARDGDRADGSAGTEPALDARISLATIAQPGPFSAFPGIDRQITLLDGPGVRLTAHNGAFDHRLEATLAPYAFDGDIALDADWIEGGASTAARVLNVMTRRGRCRATIAVMTASDAAGDAPPPSSGTVDMHFVARGAWRVADPRRDGNMATWTFGQGAYRDSTQRDSTQHASPPRPPRDERGEETCDTCLPPDHLRLTPLTPDAALIAVCITFLPAP